MTKPTPARDLSIDLKLYSYRTRRDIQLSKPNPKTYGDYNGALAHLVEADNLRQMRNAILADLRAIVAELESHSIGDKK
jgi:hypothetical protein